jgi:uncharacterized phage-associated protein
LKERFLSKERPPLPSNAVLIDRRRKKPAATLGGPANTIPVGWEFRELVSAPAIRLMPRMLLASTRQPLVGVCLSVLNRVVLTIALEASDEETRPILKNSDFFHQEGRYAASMPSVHDVARYILHKKGSMSAWKLQKLVYYSQAWHYVWEDEQLFSEPIEAWADGPVVPALFKEHRGKYAISLSSYKAGTLRNLTGPQRGSIDAVLDFYGDKSGHWLSELTHKEAPWKDAREGLGRKERGHRRITLEAMGRYYAPLDSNTPLDLV